MNNNHRPCGRISAEERLRSVQGLDTRDRLRQAIVDHNMHHPAKYNEWFHSSTHHVVGEADN